MRYPNGALGAIEATTAAWPGWQRRIEICGEQGSATLEDDHISHWDFRQAQPGDDAIIAGSVSDDEAKTIYPQGWKSPRPYIRIVPQPKGS